MTRSITFRKSVPVPLLDRGVWDFISFDNLDDESVALGLGDWRGVDIPLIRLHSECLTGDVFGSMRCDCQAQLHYAMDRIKQEGTGLILYLRQEGRGIGLKAKLDAYSAQTSLSLDTYAANRHIGHGDDERDYTQAAGMLKALGFSKVRLISNNPDKRAQLQDHGIQVIERVPTGRFECDHNHAYLNAKARHGGHEF